MTLFTVAAWIVGIGCVAMVGMGVWAIATGDTERRLQGNYLGPQPRVHYAPGEEYIPAALCAPVRRTLTAAYQPADDEITVGYSEEMIVGWELSEVDYATDNQ